MPNLIVSTCGTSLLTNGAARELVTDLNRFANCQESEIPPDILTKFQKHLNERHATLVDAPIEVDAVRKLSAELNGLLAFYSGRVPRHDEPRDMHFLLATDTYLGPQTAKLVAEWLKKTGFISEVVTRKDLNTRSMESFQSAMGELARWCQTAIQQFRESGYRVVFNLTGGFKSVNGFLQALGMFYADETVYLFETQTELLRLPRLPIRLDVVQSLRENLLLCRRLANSIAVTVAEASPLPETLRLIVDGKVAFSPWGDIAWEQHRKELYSEQVLPPLSPRLLGVNAIQSAFAKLPTDRKAIVNERLDDLSRHLDSNGAFNPKRLDFKKLEANPSPPAPTHECDAWSDGGAWRLFGYFNDQRQFVLTKLGPGLH